MRNTPILLHEHDEYPGLLSPSERAEAAVEVASASDESPKGERSAYSGEGIAVQKAVSFAKHARYLDESVYLEGVDVYAALVEALATDRGAKRKLQ